MPKVRIKNWECRCREDEHAFVDDYWWTHGACSIFAFVLKQRFGLPIYAIIEEARKDDHATLVHAFVRRGIFVWDANGPHLLKEMLALYDPTFYYWGNHNFHYKNETSRLRLVPISEQRLGDIHESFSRYRGFICDAHLYVNRNPHLFADI